MYICLLIIEIRHIAKSLSVCVNMFYSLLLYFSVVSLLLIVLHSVVVVLFSKQRAVEFQVC